METQSTLSTITIMPFTIEQRAQYVSQAVSEFNNLPAHEQAKIFIHLRTVIDTLESIFKHEDVRGAIASRMENRRIESSYGEIKYSERKSYKYDHCPVYKAMQEKIKSLESQMKVIESEMVNPETGEVIKPAIMSISEVLTVKQK